MESTLRRTWAEINLDNLTHNFETIRRAVGPEAKLLGVVKADAYGHGAVRVAKHLQKLGAAYLAVSNIDECEELRKNGVTLPILMLGFTPADQAGRILENDMTQAVQSYEIAKAFSDAAVELGKKMKVHVKLDTGMGRLGFQCDESHFDKGYNPINQIVGYILSEDPTYITNHNNARTLIRKLDRDELLQTLVRSYLGK